MLNIWKYTAIVTNGWTSFKLSVKTEQNQKVDAIIW